MHKAWVIYWKWNSEYELPAKHNYLIISLINLLHKDEYEADIKCRQASNRKS
jgi:hypothetical protein